MARNGLDPTIHQPARLRLMAILADLEPEARVDFSTFKKELGLTDGNLGSHLNKLESAGYVKVKKKFVARRPKTLLRATPKGRAAFAAHCNALREILGESV